MKIYFYLALFIFMTSCLNKNSDISNCAVKNLDSLRNARELKHTDKRLDSLRNFYTYNSTSPIVFILTMKQTHADSGIQMYMESMELCYILKKCDVPIDSLFIDNYDRPYLLKNNKSLLSTLKSENYNGSLVDSLEIHLLPEIIDSIKNESKQKNYKTLWKYYTRYNKYLIHALLRKNLKIYRDDETGLPVIWKTD